MCKQRQIIKHMVTFIAKFTDDSEMMDHHRNTIVMIKSNSIKLQTLSSCD